MKKGIYNLSALALMAGTILVACTTPDKKDTAASNPMSDTTTAMAAPVAKAKTKLDKAKVPQAVTQLFYSDYPTASVNDDSWYGYPTFDYTNDWYDYDPDLYVNDDPDAYVVEFTQDSIAHRAFYTKAGKKIAARRAVTVLPSAVSASISRGDYKTWSIGKEKEEVFKDKESDKLIVYKVSVSMGSQKHTLYFESNGKQIRDKKLS